MAKRDCPFVDYPRERKLLVTSRMIEKELTHRMEEVYEKTRKMLFNGALKNNLDKNSNMVKSLPPILDPEIQENEEQDDRPQILKGQCQLSFNGKLIPYEKATWKNGQNN